MGTRHLICIQLDNEYKLAQYGQWDGYLTGQGQDIVRFLLQKLNVDCTLNLEKHPMYKRFIKNLRNSKMLTNKQVENRWTKAGADPKSDTVSMDISNNFRCMYPQLSRDSGADTLGYILYASKPELAPNSIDFAADSLYCEWVYVINFDDETLEIFEGFNTSPVDAKSRFGSLKPKKGSKYTPCAPVAKILFCDLTLSTMEKLEKELNEKDEKLA